MNERALWRFSSPLYKRALARLRKCQAAVLLTFQFALFLLPDDAVKYVQPYAPPVFAGSYTHALWYAPSNAHPAFLPAKRPALSAEPHYHAPHPAFWHFRWSLHASQ